MKRTAYTEHPEQTDQILQQLRRTLPAEGFLTEKMAQLRTIAHQIRNGHIARLEETRQVCAKLPVSGDQAVFLILPVFTVFAPFD